MIGLADMSSGNWVVYVSLLFVALNKFLQYTASYHSSWGSRLALPNVRAVGNKYRRLLAEHQELATLNKSISAQDDYARWTKNNRKLTQMDNELKRLKEQLASATAQNKQILGKLRLVSLTLPFLALKVWKGKHVVYYLPNSKVFPKVISSVWSQGWMYLALSPLRFLTGKSVIAASATEVGVSLGIWIWALQRVIDTLEFVVKQLLLTSAVARPHAPDSHGQKHEITSDRVALD